MAVHQSPDLPKRCLPRETTAFQLQLCPTSLPPTPPLPPPLSSLHFSPPLSFPHLLPCFLQQVRPLKSQCCKQHPSGLRPPLIISFREILTPFSLSPSKDEKEQSPAPALSWQGPPTALQLLEQLSRAGSPQLQPLWLCGSRDFAQTVLRNLPGLGCPWKWGLSI